MATAQMSFAGPSWKSAPAFDFDRLLACCVAPAKPLHPETFDDLTAERFVELACRHRVVSRVYEVAARLGLPGAIRERLQDRLIVQSHQSLWLTRELLQILRHFQSRNISALPFKGPVLSQILYGSPASRQFGDLDLLVHAGDVSRAKAALIELGFTPSLQLSGGEEKAYLSSANEYVFNRGNERNLVELHWRILPRFYSVELNTESLFERSITIELSGQTVHTLSAEDLLIVLCVHNAKHAWTSLSWLCDLEQLIRSTDLDWDIVHARTRQLGVQRIVAINMALVKTLLGITVGGYPYADHATHGTAGELTTLMRQSREYDPDSSEYFRLMLRVRERWQDRMRFLSRLAFTPGFGEWQSIKLPRTLFPLYRFVRVSRLAAKLAA
jgi:hypothetical protein